jgi:UDP-2-acetamido-3-amino-2,3-dideoxy-glucuronate N-acetyltransferase
MKKTLEDVKYINFDVFTDVVDIGWDWGSLVPINLKKDMPIEVNRLFYVYSVSNTKKRGEHAHHKNKQILICLNGKCGVVCKDGKNTKSYILESPSVGLYIPEMIWDEQVYFTTDTVLLVLCSMEYDKNDYIESWDEYLLRNA